MRAKGSGEVLECDVNWVCDKCFVFESSFAFVSKYLKKPYEGDGTEGWTTIPKNVILIRSHDRLPYVLVQVVDRLSMERMRNVFIQEAT